MFGLELSHTAILQTNNVWPFPGDLAFRQFNGEHHLFSMLLLFLFLLLQLLWLASLCLGVSIHSSIHSSELHFKGITSNTAQSFSWIDRFNS